MEIYLKSCLNIRDLGGTVAAGGRTVQTGRIIRSAKTDTLTPEDAQQLKDRFRLTTIIDLRTEKEAAEKPDNTFGCKYYNIPLRPDVKAGIKYRFPSSLKTFSKKFPSMPQMYVDMLTSEYSTGQMKRVFSIIFDSVQNDGCVLFHCSEGKDRTGIIAALIELMLGVDREMIMKNYLYSNEFFKKRNRGYYILSVIAFLDISYAKEFGKMYEAHPSMLYSLFSIIDGFGGIDDYFTGHLQFSQTDIDSFREKMFTAVKDQT